MTVSALFIDSKGLYPGMLGAENCWGVERDARLYVGPHPVVAHPPCQLWGAMANVNFARYGGEHNRPGNDGGCFASALESIRRCGGVLEHPARSRAWLAHGLVKPVRGRWTLSSSEPRLWTCEISQCAYGHKARKRTWLAYCGKQQPFEMRWNEPAYTHQIGHDGKRKRPDKLPTLWNKAASATPEAFAEELIRLAEWSHAARDDSTWRQIETGMCSRPGFGGPG